MRYTWSVLVFLLCINNAISEKTFRMKSLVRHQTLLKKKPQNAIGQTRKTNGQQKH